MTKEPKKGFFSFRKKDKPQENEKEKGGFFSKFSRKKDSATDTLEHPEPEVTAEPEDLEESESGGRLFGLFRRKKEEDAASEMSPEVPTDESSSEVAPEPEMDQVPGAGLDTETIAPAPAAPAVTSPAQPMESPALEASPSPAAAPAIPTESQDSAEASEAAEVAAPDSPETVETAPREVTAVEQGEDESTGEEKIAEEGEDEDAGEEKKSRFGFFRRKDKDKEESQEEQPESETDEDKPKRGWLQKLKDGLKGTREKISGGINRLFLATKQIDEDLLEELEELLISTDIGVQTSLDIIEKVRLEVSRKTLKNGEELKIHLKKELQTILDDIPNEGFNIDRDPTVILVIGVNGVGKTTTIGKLARLWQREGKSVTVCAADTFRAAAVEQLQIWAERADVDIVLKPESKDPAAVVFDALERVKHTGSDILLVDTAGRLHNNPNLMNELGKIRRIIERSFPDAPHHVLLILDAVTGQNGLLQAKEFASKIGVTDLIVTKLDGTAKGGIAVAIAQELQLPIQYIGVGEGVDHLLAFNSQEFVNSMFED
ncbi:signal recognition particle-docking protein FtsY [Sulfidibacter corallicola]